ncbi:MAG: YkgJ family cysteine cluster protein [Spirochaetales bacterium]|nr:YkgJ family cysteine cluster protein [Spirochaetales bacterium]
MTVKDIFHEYGQFLSQVDRECDRLSSLYADFLQCGPRCFHCCRSLTLLPLEWHFLKDQAKGHKKKAAPSEEACPFLVDSLCSIYDFRPLICRTHGLPLLYLNEEGRSWELSYCDLNFLSLDDERMEEVFQTDNLLNMERLNIRLNGLNGDFLRTPEGAGYSRSTRLSMDEIPDRCR